MTALERRIAAWLTPQRVRLYPATAIVVVLVGYVVSISIGVGPTDAAGAIIGADFSAFYWAGTALREGADHLYDMDAESELLAALIAPAPYDGEVHAFVSPPYWALFFAPFARLPYLVALAAFSTLSALLLALNVALLRHALGLDRIPLGRALLWALCFYPVPFAFLDGQTSMVVLFPLVLAYVALRRGKDFAAGLAIGLLAVKPQLAVCLGLVILGGRRWQALLGAAISGGACVALGWWLLPDAMREYAEVAPQLFVFLRDESYQQWGQLSIVGLGTLLLDPLSMTAGSILGYGLAIALALVILVENVRAEWKPGTRAWDLRIAASVLAGLVATPHLFLYDASLFLLPLAIVVAWLGSKDETQVLDGGRVLAAVGILWVALFAGPYLTDAIQDALVAMSLPPVVVQLPTLAILWLAWRLRDQARTPV